MTLVVRDPLVEADALDRAERLAGVTGYTDRVLERMAEVEYLGGPDQPAGSFVEAVKGAHEEAIDGGAWSLVALHLVGDERSDPEVFEATLRVQDGMACLARAEHAFRGALDLLAGR